MHVITHTCGLIKVIFYFRQFLQPLFCLFLQSASPSPCVFHSDADQSLPLCSPALEPLQRFVHICCSSLFSFNQLLLKRAQVTPDPSYICLKKPCARQMWTYLTLRQQEQFNEASVDGSTQSLLVETSFWERSFELLFKECVFEAVHLMFSVTV